ncbi:winged helix DNA-binding domain-containing protein [Streptomyces sp. NPDC087300]|uniref:winged helix DNA-binding domain-containing protein n=1 Tax=Streptomyces sp. NPDC087300 TaxID=3365780 RepID=UPI0038182783
MGGSTGAAGSGGRGSVPPVVLGRRALNRATLDRQLLLRRATGLSVEDAVGHLVGLQAQNVKPPYYALAARLAEFDPAELSGLLADRRLVRTVTMRSTIHLHTAEDALPVRQLMQNALERELTAFRSGLVGVDLVELAGIAREAVEAAPRTMKQLREVLLVRWPDADPQSLGIAARCVLPLVQVTPRGLWRRSGQVALTTAERWLGVPGPAQDPSLVDAMVVRYLAAFGPASVKDMQAWARLTRLREVFERLRPGLRTFHDENGVELFDLPDAPRPDPDTPAPPRFLPEYDNLLLSHADRARVVPAAYKGRTWKGNYPYCVFLYDGYLAGLWRLVEDAASGAAVLTVEPFEPVEKLGRAGRDALTAEAERMLTRIAETSTSYDIRFGTVYGTVIGTAAKTGAKAGAESGGGSGTG